MTDDTQKQLTQTVKRALDILRVFAIACLILWPLAVLGMVAGQASHPESWGVDIDVYSAIAINLDELTVAATDSSGVRAPNLSGKASLSIDTSSTKALVMFTLITELGGIVALYVLIQLRAVFAALVAGENFVHGNASRIKKVGFIVIAWAFAQPPLQYLSSQVILSEYSLAVPGIQLFPAFEFHPMALFIGVALMILAGVLKEAAGMRDDLELTV